MAENNVIHVINGRVPQYNFPEYVWSRRSGTTEILASNDEILSSLTE